MDLDLKIEIAWAIICVIACVVAVWWRSKSS